MHKDTSGVSFKAIRKHMDENVCKQLRLDTDDPEQNLAKAARFVDGYRKLQGILPEGDRAERIAELISVLRDIVNGRIETALMDVGMDPAQISERKGTRYMNARAIRPYANAQIALGMAYELLNDGKESESEVFQKISILFALVANGVIEKVKDTIIVYDESGGSKVCTVISMPKATTPTQETHRRRA